MVTILGSPISIAWDRRYQEQIWVSFFPSRPVQILKEKEIMVLYLVLMCFLLSEIDPLSHVLSIPTALMYINKIL